MTNHPAVRGCTLAEAIATAAGRLAAVGIDGAARDARIIAAAAVGISAETLLARPEMPLGSDAQARLDVLVRRRAAGEPVSRILGRRAFYGRDFLIAPAVLDPRPDTETLVDLALSLMRQAGQDRPLRLLDVGTGSGCLALTLLAEHSRATAVATDISAPALAIAGRNADLLGVGHRLTLVETDLVAAITGRFDLIVSNPPYVASGDIADLAREVRCHDPLSALDGGPDGLAFYRRIAADVTPLLAAGGWLAVEVGAGQAEAVETLLTAAIYGSTPPGAPLDVLRAGRDLAGIHRCVAVRARSVNGA
ncbi:MAG: peptide chain release factor N(5)-glutamine methyltransferase [Hyphomicrobiaceae bacterium]